MTNGFEALTPTEPWTMSGFSGCGGWNFPRREEDDCLVFLLPSDLHDCVIKDIPNSVMATGETFRSWANKMTRYERVEIDDLSWQEYGNAWFAHLGSSRSLEAKLWAVYSSGEGWRPWLAIA